MRVIDIFEDEGSFEEQPETGGQRKTQLSQALAELHNRISFYNKMLAQFSERYGICSPTDARVTFGTRKYQMFNYSFINPLGKEVRKQIAIPTDGKVEPQRLFKMWLDYREKINNNIDQLSDMISDVANQLKSLQ